MTFEEEPSTDDSIDLVNQTPVMVSVGSLLENYSVPSTSAILPGNEFTLNFNSITSDDGYTRIFNPIAEVAHAIELIESHSSGNRLNLFASLEQNSKYGENPQESASGQASVTSPQATDVSNTENIVSEDDAGVESVISDDDDVVIIEPPTTESDPIVTEQQTKHFNPTLVLQHILQDKAELQKMFQLGKYATEAMFVRLWASSSKIPTAPEKITAALEKWQRAKDENITLLHEKNTISEKLKNSTEENKRNLIEINRLKSQLGDEQQKRSELECRTKEVQSNAKLIIDSLKEKVEQTKASYEEKISSQLLECEEKQLEQAQEEFNNLKMEKQRIEEALTQIQQEHFACADSKYDPEKILMFKLSDHCQVCYSPASIHCCVHHNYCSISHKNEDYEAHQKVCVNPRKRRTKLEVKSTTVRSITQENLDESQEISGVREKTTFKQEKSSFIHRRTLWSTLPSLADRALPESSHSLKKRRKNRSQKKT